MENKYVFHILGLSHLPASREYSSCAFTAKNIKLSKMLVSLEHTVYLYGARTTNPNYNVEEYINSDNFHFVETHTVDDIARSFGSGNNIYEVGYPWPEGEFVHDLNAAPDKISECTKKFQLNCTEKINEIKKPDDFLLITQGNFHRPIVEKVGLYLRCESGVGYRGSGSDWFRCFESSYAMNFAYGSEKPFASQNGRFFDRVIANYFDPDDFEYSEKKDDYFLFMARLIRRKGILEAYLASKEVGTKLIIAGQCGKVLPNGHLTSVYPNEFDIPPGNWEYVGFKGVEERKKLMSYAKAFWAATEYLECFGGTHVEAMLSGTPPITTNFGVFGDGATFIDGVHGFRCDTLDDFVWAAKNAGKLDPKVIRKNGERFLMDNVKWQYQKWFEDLYALWESTQNPKVNGWHRIRTEVPEWRKHVYPHLAK